jgi:hypothetical protein
MSQLETLKRVASLRLLANHVHHRLDQLGPLGVVPLGPVVTGSGLPVDEVVRAKEPPEGSAANRVHGTGLEVDQDGAGDVLAVVHASAGLVVVDGHALQLERAVANVVAGRVDAMLVADGLPELRA